MNSGKKLPPFVKLYNPPPEFKAGSDFLISYPEEYLEELHRRRNEIWDDINFDDIKSKWLLVVKEKNRYHNRNFRSRVEMYSYLFGIPEVEYKNFLNDVDKVIGYINQKVVLDKKMFEEKESNNYCFICRSKSFPFVNADKIFDFIVGKYPVLKKNKDKIKILLTEEDSRMKYEKELDVFKVILDGRLSQRHQAMDLVHEIGHVFDMLKCFKKDKLRKKKYGNEKAAVRFELNFLKKYYPELFLVKLGNVLQSIQISLFEIGIYGNSDLDPDKLYAECFNKCFTGAEQKKNRGYLLNKDIIYNSFKELSYSIAYVNVLQNLI